jgi:hypothetical protein
VDTELASRDGSEPPGKPASASSCSTGTMEAMGWIIELLDVEGVRVESPL